MVDAIQNDCGLVETAPRPIRKKFAKPPVKVACLPWCVFNAAPIANRRWPGGGFVFVANLLSLVALPERAVAGRNPVPMYGLCHPFFESRHILFMFWGDSFLEVELVARTDPAVDWSTN
jgi:hypothetical protein